MKSLSSTHFQSRGGQCNEKHFALFHCHVPAHLLLALSIVVLTVLSSILLTCTSRSRGSPKARPPRPRKLFVTDLPLRTTDHLYSALKAAFAPYGLVRVKIVGVDLTKSFQNSPSLMGIISLQSAAAAAAAMGANQVVAGQQVLHIDLLCLESILVV